ncbi:MAG: hypothetical protein Q3X95_05715 [Duodenibacillus sp.]|nr:hypothetical protein [Duodenibacillus sp.]
MANVDKQDGGISSFRGAQKCFAKGANVPVKPTPREEKRPEKSKTPTGLGRAQSECQTVAQIFRRRIRQMPQALRRRMKAHAKARPASKFVRS